MKIKPEVKQLILYIAKCITGVGLVYLLSVLFNFPDYGWCAISVLLVVSPDSKEAVPLALTRVKANLAAGVVSVLALLLGGKANIITISVAMVLTILLCYFFKLMAGSRSALAAIIIIMLHSLEIGQVHSFWYNTIERVISVILGCIFAIVVTFIYHRQLSYPRKGIKTNDSEG